MLESLEQNKLYLKLKFKEKLTFHFHEIKFFNLISLRGAAPLREIRAKAKLKSEEKYCQGN